MVGGNLGVSPGTAITGFPPGQITPPGIAHPADAVASQAQADVATAYVAIATTPTLVDLTNTNLGGLTLTPGVYGFAAAAQLTGTLTLDALGNPNAVFLFKVGSTLTSASNANVLVINGGSACNVYWQVGSSATLGTNTTFAGNILALSSITLNTGVTLNGRALARNGAVTLASNNIGGCASAPVVCPTVTLTPAALPAGVTGSAFAAAVLGSGGSGPYTYGVSSGALPPGVTLNAGSGALSGMPGAVGTFNFTVTATDANGCAGSRAYTIVVSAPNCPAISLNPAALPSAHIGAAYSQVVTSSGGVGPSTYTTTGSLPAGINISALGAVTGTPTVAGLFSFSVRATDANGCTGDHAYTVSVVAGPAPVITVSPVNLQGGALATPYAQPVTASGGTAPYTYAVSMGALPPGLTINASTGAIAGTPTVVGNYSFAVTVTDANANAGVHAYSIVITAAVVAPVTVSPPSLPAGTVGTPYLPIVTGTGGTAPYTYSIVSGALPSGLVINPNTGGISGSPTQAGTFTFTVQVTDALGNLGLGVFTVVIAAAAGPVSVEPIPTVGQWALALLAILLSLVALPYLARRHG